MHRASDNSHAIPAHLPRATPLHQKQHRKIPLHSVRSDRCGLSMGVISLRTACRLFLFLTMFSSLLTSSPSGAAETDANFFEAKIRPVLVGTCFRCHGDLKSGASLRVDSRDALVKGGESGPAIVPGDPDSSLLIKAVQRHEGVSAMPPEKEKALRPDQVADLIAWVRGGAAWPATTSKFVAGKHWAFEPVRDPAIPVPRDQDWGRTSLDHFIRAQQELAGVRPVPTAGKRTLIRRATFDLTGLPPTPDAIEAFENDVTPEAFPRVVDRLLDSPAYGERWGRHWLDVVRYADTAGETADYPVPVAWRYRNYVIDAFNQDKPYDEFLREQIAGDVLAAQQPNDRYAERITATGYLAISRRFGFDSENYHHLTIQDTIDTLGQTALGLSLGCARCHDHKFDPISMQDYYGLYGIFDSSRYAFPGSEQKQKVRSMVPLLPPSESLPKWRAYETRVATIAASLERQKQPVPGAILRSLNDLDGDFEMQAAAAGGSNGVLVPPWLYEGKIAVTNAAQSPFKNVYPRGRVGASIPAGAGEYRIAQALYPQRSSPLHEIVYLSLDFRVTAPDPNAQRSHRFWMGSLSAGPAAELLISHDSLALRIGETTDRIAMLAPGQWQNVQLAVNLKARTLAGRVGVPGNTTEFFSNKLLETNWTGILDFIVLDSAKQGESHQRESNQAGATLPAIEFDNLAVQDSPFALVSTQFHVASTSPSGIDPVAIAKELEELTGFDGDFELQTQETAPANPWQPGPNSQVKLTTQGQSPFVTSFPPGELGIQMPNRAEYDGFGRTLANAKPNANGELFVAFDFRCANADAGGEGSWRYYIGHGPGPSAALELFFNGRHFFRRSAASRDLVAPLVIGEWYQVQVTLNLTTKTYQGQLKSATTKTEFTGELATGWDGAIDYTFIDSYGHLGGIRPSLHADNFVINATGLPAGEPAIAQDFQAKSQLRRSQVLQLRQQLAETLTDAELSKQELNKLLAEGPFPLTYGMAEGTPHNVRVHLRGETDRLGSEVPRGFVRVLEGGPLPDGTTGSGRLELAQWLTRAENPLTARVMVNRIWQYHFGRGLVKTPNDFGVRGVPPTHPELLDHLARQFMQSGWSIKTMHRLVMLSATYQQASADDLPLPGLNGSVDVNDLYVGFARRRLDAEEIRDAILMVSGELDTTLAQEHPFPTPISWGYSQHGPFSAVYDHNKRSVYLMTQRLKRHPFLGLFDGADPNASTAARLETTVPTQALFFLNDPFVHTKSEKLAVRLRAATAMETVQINLASCLAIGRSLTDLEQAEAVQFLQLYRTELTAAGQSDIELRGLAAYVRTLFGCNEFLHLD